MKEKGIFFNEEQKELLKEIDILENKTIPFEDERKSLSTVKRMEMADIIISKYSILKKQKGIFHEQLFSAMEEYLKKCIDTGYRFKGL